MSDREGGRMSIHEQAWNEATQRFGGDETRAEQRRADWKDGFLAGHEAATRTRVVTTVTELDALPVGSVVLDNSSIAVQRRVTGWWTATGAHSLPTGIIAAEGLPARVLYDPEETL